MGINRIFYNTAIPQTEKIKTRSSQVQISAQKDTFTLSENGQKIKEARKVLDEKLLDIGFDDKKIQLYNVKPITDKLKEYPIHSLEIPNRVLSEVLTIGLIKNVHPRETAKNIEILANNMTPEELNQFFHSAPTKSKERYKAFENYITQDNIFFKNVGLPILQKESEFNTRI